MSIKPDKKVWGVLIGSIVGGIAASACCVLPAAFLSLGIAGAWMANLKILEPFRPVFLTGAWGAWGWALWQERRKEEACMMNGTCQKPAYGKFWVSAGLLGFLTVSPWLIRWIL